MKKIRLKENRKIERFKCDNSKMMQLATNSKNYHKKKLEEKLLIQLNNLNNTLNKNKVQEIQENILLEILCLEYQKELE